MGAKQTERGQELRRAVGMAGKMAGRQTKPAEQALQADTASGFSARHRPQNNERPTVGRPRSETTAADQRRPASRRAVQVGGGVQWYWPSGRRAQTYLACPYPTYRLCLSLSLPTPLICKTQFSPNLTFFVCFYFYPYSPL